ncbi:nucleoside hydrolase [Halobacteria archaeon HArc-gm2]|nr:nucleoside hydrolase [Halobacteria archaeon HArc-gm2]
MPTFPALSTSDRLDALTPPAGDVSVVVDTDAYNEIDDQFALAYALSATGLDVEAVYAAPFHNARSSGPGDGMAKSYEEIQCVVDRVGREPANGVFEGSTEYLGGPSEPVDSPAARDLVERARSHEGDDPLYVVAIGAPTNVASALLRAPEILEDLVVVWLGGTPHDWHTAEEFNLRQDVHASRVLFDSGVPLVHVPCRNVAEHLRVSLPELREYLDDGALSSYLVEITEAYFEERAGPGPVRSTVQWDVVPVAWLRDPDLVPTDVVHSPELSSELTWNRDPGRQFVRVAREIDRDGIWTDFFESVRR